MEAAQLKPVPRLNARRPERVEILSPVETTTFEEAAEWYDYAQADHFWFQWRLRAVLGLVDDLGLPRDRPLRVLDVGCGNGALAGQLEAASQWTVDGTDLNLGALRRVPEGRGRVFYYNVFDQRDELLGRYDLVTLCDVIEHVDPTGPFLAAVVRHLRPGGHLLINVPALQAMYGPYDVAAGHIRRYTKRSLAQACAGLDLEIIGLRYWGLSMLPVLALRSILFRLKRPKDSVLRRGFVPPGRLADGLLHLAMRLETALVRRPPLGTSVLLVARRR